MDALSDFEALLSRAGITQDKPLYPVLVTVYRSVLALDHRPVADIERAVRQSLTSIKPQYERLWTWRRWSYAIAAGAVVCACVSLVSFRLGVASVGTAASERAAVELLAYVSAWCADRVHQVSENGGVVCPVKLTVPTEAKR